MPAGASIRTCTVCATCAKCSAAAVPQPLPAPLDATLGPALQVDRHKYVKLAFHGFSQLSREERMQQYNNAGEDAAAQHCW